MDDNRLAEDLRLTIGQLVRTVRTADTMPPVRPPSWDIWTAAAR